MILKYFETKTFINLLETILKDRVVVEFNTLKSFSDKTQQGRFLVKIHDKSVASFTLVAMPGCCGILISTGAWIQSEYRNKGIGKLLNLMRIQIAHEWEYSLMLCTDVTTNTPQQRILQSHNWKDLGAFLNTRTDNIVKIHTIDIKPTEFKLGFELI